LGGISSLSVNILIKYCPIITRLCAWLWNSPTFTTWGNQGVQALRLVLVTPLILTRFNETEIAAWYLFASLNFFGTILAGRIGLSFSRMFSFAMGGASDLGPIRRNRVAKSEGNPNWEVFEQAYGTLGSLNAVLGFVNVFIAASMGWFGLSNLLDGYAGSATIWFAFAIMQASSLVTFIFQRFSVALNGMNYIALVARWGMIFGLLSVFLGSITLLLGGGIIALVCVMQTLVICDVLRSYFLLHYVESGRVARFTAWGFDGRVFKWAWEPSWKGVIIAFTDLGVVQLSGIIAARVFSAGELASYLLTLRLVQTVAQLSSVPVHSITPKLARLIASDNCPEMRQVFLSRVRMSLILMGVGLGFLLALGPLLLGLIGSNVVLIPRDILLVLAGLTLHRWFCNFSGTPCSIANNIVYIGREAMAGLIAILLIFLWPTDFDILSLLLVAYLPKILILNVAPGVIGASYLRMRAPSYLAQLYAYTSLSLLIIVVFRLFNL